MALRNTSWMRWNDRHLRYAGEKRTEWQAVVEGGQCFGLWEMQRPQHSPVADSLRAAVCLPGNLAEVNLQSLLLINALEFRHLAPKPRWSS